MTVDEREEEVARREAEHALRDDERRQAPPLADRPVDEPVERRRADLEQTPVPARE